MSKQILCKDCNVNNRVKNRSYCQQCYWKRFKSTQRGYDPKRRDYMERNRNYIHRYKQIYGCQKCGEKRYWILPMTHRGKR